MNHKLSIIVLAAGKSSRMKSDISKVLHKVAGWSVLRHVLHVAAQLSPERVVLVTSDGADDIVAEGRACVDDIIHVVQHDAQGTGHAVQQAMPSLDGFDGQVLVLYGDSPLMTAATLQSLLHVLDNSDVALTAMRPHDPAQYGRIITNGDGQVDAIVEYNDANEAQRAVTLCNAGVMAFHTDALRDYLDDLSNDNAKSEYYLTDMVGLVRKHAGHCRHIVADEEETLGINNRAELAHAESVIQSRLRADALARGVGMTAPDTVFLSMDTVFGHDVLIEPYVYIGENVVLGDYATVRAFSHVEGTRFEEHAKAGPYARLRQGTVLHKDAAVGNFVEIKNATLQENVKAGHLSYIGDADIGAYSNIGAGTITCNYDGTHKHRTVLGEHVFVGSDTALVAPVTVGSHVTIAAGSVVTDDVPDDALAIARARQVVKTYWNPQ